MGLFDKKVKLAEEQRIIVEGIAAELKIPEEEVLWTLIELGSVMCLLTESSPEMKEVINNKFGDLPEYKNWQRIAKSLTAAFIRGGEEIDKT